MTIQTLLAVLREATPKYIRDNQRLAKAVHMMDIEHIIAIAQTKLDMDSVVAIINEPPNMLFDALGGLCEDEPSNLPEAAALVAMLAALSTLQADAVIAAYAKEECRV
jgi:hypothetical protein